HGSEIDRCLGAAEEGDIDQPPFNGERAEIALDVIAADHIKDQIDALAVRQLLDDLDEILLLVVDPPLRAEFLDCPAFFIRRCRRKDPRAERPGKLDSRRSDATCAAMDEEALPAIEAAAIKHIRPDREEGFRKRRGLDEIKSFRDV